MPEKRFSSELIDQFGRIHSNLRISITDRCNFRCQYCVLSEKINWIEPQQALTPKEILLLVKIFSELGIDRLRITGGEPLVNSDVIPIIKRIKSDIPAIKNINMTSNGILLNKYLTQLEESKLDTINISLDTLRPERFKIITRNDSFQQVLDNIKSITLTPINTKINTVLMRNLNEDEIFDFIAFSDEHDIEIRFIEFMPFTGNRWLPTTFIPSQEIRDTIQTRYHLNPVPLSHPSQTSRIYEIEGTNARIGLISSVSESFCQWCNRLRITADGNLRNCLHGKSELSLKSLLTKEFDVDCIKQKILSYVFEKQRGHVNFLAPGFEVPSEDREMMRIGG